MLLLIGIIIMKMVIGNQSQFTLGDNCLQSEGHEVKCTCNEKEMTLSFDTVNIGSSVIDLRIENCTETLTVKDEALLSLALLEKISFRNIVNLTVHKGAMELHGGEMEFRDIKNLILFPGSITIPGDGVSKVIIVDSVVHPGTLDGPRAGRTNGQGKVVQDAMFKCNCQDFYYPKDNPVIDVMKKAMNCSNEDKRVRVEKCVRAPPPASGSSLVPIFFFSILPMVFLL
ncbi:uncharacterized protein [Palaemon carinicauda]|uniref:uncharacterized protein n=1 Tax=Palaemon carinicauda TaxID=392227 RepID=UPI0035B60FCE